MVTKLQKPNGISSYHAKKKSMGDIPSILQMSQPSKKQAPKFNNSQRRTPSNKKA
jgi:hypothetical protein